MRGTRRAGTWLGLGAGILALATAACAPKVGRRQTEVMEKSGQVSVSAALLRAKTNVLADRFADRFEETADRIRTGSSDRAVRRRALAFKVDVVPAVYTAAYRADPLAAAMDLWALAFQAVQYVEDGAGRDAFGAGQPLAREASHDLLAETDTFVQGFAARPEDFVQARGKMEAWVRTHPIQHTFSSRPSVAAFAAELRSEGRDAFVAVGQVTDTIETVSERLNTYAAQLPKLARWQAELLISEETGERDVEDVLGDVAALGATARRTNELLDDVPGVVGAAESPLRRLLADERRAVLEGVNQQRHHTLEFVTAERLAVLAAVREERVATVAALRQERIETLAEVDAIKTRAVDSAVAGLRDLLDYALWRVFGLLVVLMVSATVLGVIGYRLTVGRRRGTASA